MKSGRVRPAKFIASRCRVCGCTETTPCQLEDGLPCAWLDLELLALHIPPCEVEVMLDGIMLRVEQ